MIAHVWLKHRFDEQKLCQVSWNNLIDVVLKLMYKCNLSVHFYHKRRAPGS